MLQLLMTVRPFIVYNQILRQKIARNFIFFVKSLKLSEKHHYLPNKIRAKQCVRSNQLTDKIRMRHSEYRYREMLRAKCPAISYLYWE
ncbi:hypothetical protein CRP01_26010 [Flavilitoribacter nigricans DSM 23189 = NBRC 102662]|uniref:Uncharacterized protein n=1 Tax=Flavilitoribacter nigricans (strain ATCC 23147 / DSM 23189 / NBRC 102662 / NCIMB 1420 / SS-2) TaxID=1122177 RepID=A0A2D0N4L6_FLAN2|nr:hypothetical protein CRP01_26010 [Flavilitoribacter nigricans DSM 23189 = NBRC 102662]